MTLAADTKSRIGRYEGRPATAADAPALTALFAEAPMAGDIRLAFERLDPWAVAGIQARDSQIMIAKCVEPERIVAAYAFGERPVYLNGEVRNIPYLSDLRISPDVRGGFLLHRGFRHLRNQFLPPPSYAQTLILRQNHTANDLLCSGRAGLPTYFPCGDYEHFAIPTRQAATHRRAELREEIRTATPADLPAMQALQDAEAPRRQFRPVYDFTQLGTGYYRDLRLDDFVCVERGSRLVGFAALWDLRALRRTRIAGYSPRYRALRLPYNLFWGRWFGLPLPVPDTILREAHIAAMICRDDDPTIARALIDALLEHGAARQIDLLHLGMAATDPLLPALNRLRRRNFPGRHYLVGYGADPRPGLDDRPFYFESARI